MRTAARILTNGYETLLTGAIWFALMLFTGWCPTWPAAAALLSLGLLTMIAAAICSAEADRRENAERK